ncbi:MAG: hypothetical protein ACOY0T_10355 [Myxococcota bacterium]
MRSKLPLVVGLKESCPMRWEDMQAGDGQRFCHVCQKHVVDLSALSVDEAREQLTRGGCVNFQFRPDGSIVTRDELVRRPGAARVVMAAALVALTGCGGGRAEDADYPRLGGAILEEDEPGWGEGGAGAAGAPASANVVSTRKASCER